MSAETALDVIRRHLQPLASRRVLDCGCGGGALAKTLAAEGASVTGIDPVAETVAAARASVSDASFEIARAEALPFADASFDAVIFLNALHHVPAAMMAQALREARRVVTQTGRVLVIEPLAEGSYNAVLKIIDDETVIRAQAQRVVAAFAAYGFERAESMRFDRRDLFETFDAFLTRTVAVDAARQAAVTERRTEIEEAFHRYAVRDDKGRYGLVQPHKADVLAVR